eukprot:250551-Alexandrium_andersonii.AAC.1
MRRVGFADWAPWWRWSKLTTRTPWGKDNWTIPRRKKSEQLGRRPASEGLGVLDGEADPEVHASRSELDTLEGEVRAKADLLVFFRNAPVLRQAAQVLRAP